MKYILVNLAVILALCTLLHLILFKKSLRRSETIRFSANVSFVQKYVRLLFIISFLLLIMYMQITFNLSTSVFVLLSTLVLMSIFRLGRLND